MADKKKQKKKMVYTPKCHIPIGEAVKNENGEYALRIKKPNSPDIEVVSIVELLSEVIQTAEK